MARFLGRTLGWIVAFAVLGIVLELTVRVHLFGLDGLDPRKVNSLRDFRASEFIQVSDSPAIGFEQAPNVEGFFKLVPFRTNDAGLRDRNYLRNKPAKTFRVAVVGSSFTLPAGVRIEDAFHSRMEEHLNESGDGITFEFINFAVGAIHPRQVTSILEERALAWDPDLVLFGVTSMSMPFMEFSQATPEGGHVSRRLPRTYPFFDSFLIALAKQRLGRADAAMPTFHPNKPSVSSGGSILDTLGRISRSRDLPIVILRLEFDAHRDSAGDQDVIKAVRREGLYFFDTRSRFDGLNARKLWIHPLDPHPNAAAHALFADAVLNYLEENSLLVNSAQ